LKIGEVFINYVSEMGIVFCLRDEEHMPFRYSVRTGEIEYIGDQVGENRLLGALDRFYGFLEDYQLVFSGQGI
jgi:hypothetical protein